MEVKMSISQTRLNEATLNSVQPSSSSHPSTPPWNQSSLQSYCNQINEQHGSRGSKYTELLNHLSEAIQGQLTLEDFDDLGCNLLTLIQNIPGEIKERETIKEALERVFFFQPSSDCLQLLRNFCSHVNQSVGTRTVVYQEVLGLMESSLRRGVAFTKIELIGRCFTLVKHEMPSDIKNKDNIKKISSALDKHLTSLLKNYCLFINQGEIGDPIAAYRGILNAIEEAIQLQTTIEELHRLSRHLMLTIQLMSPERSRTQEMEERINRVRQRLVELYRSHFGPLRESLLDARRSSDVLSTQGRIELISCELPKELDPILEKEVEKCVNFSNRKFLTRCFVEHQDNMVDTYNTSLLSSVPPSEELETTRFQQRSIYPILSIDGGGIRGIIPATVLVAIERFTNEPIANLFQLIGGTSTGGILTLGLTKPRLDGSGLPEYRAQDLLNLYTEHHHQIFRSNPLYREDTSGLKFDDKIREAIRNPKYQTPGLFQERFGNAWLSSALTDVVITANTHEAIVSKVSSVSLSALTGMISFCAGLFGYKPTPIWSHDSLPKEVHLFTKQGLKSLSYSLGDSERRYESSLSYSSPIASTEVVKEYSIYPEVADDFLMADIAKVTSAAPSYFPPVSYKDKLFMDGGVLQNNPSIPCVLEALDRGHGRDSLFILSLGTGVEPRRTPRANFGSALTSLWFETTQPHFQEDLTLMNMLDRGASYRFQYRFGNHAPDLDDTSPATITMLQESGNELVEENVDQIREVCRVLRPESI
jgi:hypothetical protein